MKTRNLRLVYFHGKSVFTGKMIDIKLSGKYNVTFSNGQYLLEVNPRYIDDFWQDGIADISMAVGNNGSGKSDICNTLLSFLCSSGGGGSEDAFLLCEANNDIKVIVRETTKHIPTVLWNSKKHTSVIHDISVDTSLELLKTLQFIYYKPSLDEYDYKRLNITPSNFYNASLGGLLHSAGAYQYNSKPLSISMMPEFRADIALYFVRELEETLRFFKSIKDITSGSEPDNKAVVNDMLRYPQNIKIEVNDYNSYLGFMVNRKERLLKKLPDIKPISDALHRLEQRISEKSFNDNLVLNILLAPLYMACIKDMSLSHELQNEYTTFCGRYLSNLEAAQFNSNDSFDFCEWAMSFMEKLISSDTDHINPCIEDAIAALRSMETVMDMWSVGNIYYGQNEAFINFYELMCGNTVDKSLDSLISFMDLVDRLELDYSFISYDFALSTGEFTVWKMLCKLYNATQNRQYSFNYVVLDEPDMSLHPEWQRRLINILDWFSSLLYKESNTKFQFFITTHSPIMLSDMPMDRVVYLYHPKDNAYNICNDRDFNTFGNVIYNLYNDAFFLDENGQVGEHAQNWINSLIQELKAYDDPESPRYLDNEQIMYFEKKIFMIGDSVLQRQLLRMLYRRARNSEIQIGLVDRKIQETEEYLKYLRRMNAEHDTDQI